VALLREEVRRISTYSLLLLHNCCLSAGILLGRGFGRGPIDDGPPAEVVGIYPTYLCLN
jgi:hypothetical protein